MVSVGFKTLETMFTQRGEVCNPLQCIHHFRVIFSNKETSGILLNLNYYGYYQSWSIVAVKVMDKYHIYRTKVILTRTMELSITVGMWYISSVSINSCDIVEISINAVSTLHQSLWLDGTSRIWFEPVASSLSAHGIKVNHVV